MGVETLCDDIKELMNRDDTGSSNVGVYHAEPAVAADFIVTTAEAVTLDADRIRPMASEDPIAVAGVLALCPSAEITARSLIITEIKELTARVGDAVTVVNAGLLRRRTTLADITIADETAITIAVTVSEAWGPDELPDEEHPRSEQ